MSLSTKNLYVIQASLELKDKRLLAPAKRLIIQ